MESESGEATHAGWDGSVITSRIILSLMYRLSTLVSKQWPHPYELD